MGVHNGRLAALLSWWRLVRSDPLRYDALAAEELAKPGVNVTERALLFGIRARVDAEFDRVDLAIRRLYDAVELIGPDGHGTVLAELSALLANVLTMADRCDEALAVLDRASGNAGAAATGVLQIQRAAVFYRIGPMRTALAAVDEALQVIDADERVLRARALNNRGIIRLYVGDMEACRADFDESEAIYRAENLHAAAAEVAHNRAMVDAREGDLVAALANFARAEDELRRLGVPTDAQAVARAEILVAIGLHEEVLEELPPVIERLRANRMMADADEGAVYLAQAMYETGHPDAEASLVETADHLRASNRSGWAAVLDDVTLELRLATDGPRPELTMQAERVAMMLDHLGMQVFAARSWLRVAEAALACGDLPRARRALEVVSARRDSAAQRALSFEARARLRLIDGDVAAARRLVDQGLHLVDRLRAVMNATDLRVQASGWGDGLARLGVAIEADTGDAARLLAAAERWRAVAAFSRPARPVDDPEMTELLSELRTANVVLRSGSQPDRDAARRNVRAAEQAITRAARRRPGASGGDLDPPVDEMVGMATDGRVVVELIDDRNELLAVVVRESRASTCSLGPSREIVDSARALQQGLRQLAQTAATPAGTLLAAGVRRHLKRLRELVADPLADALADCRELVVVPTPALQSLPWAMLVPAGLPVAVAPSARLWLRAAPEGPIDGRVVVVAGPGLPGALQEANEVANCYPNAVLRAGGDARVEEVRDLLDSASVAHIAAHAHVRVASPLFSSIQLADGPATAYDLDRLTRAPQVMVLSACSSGITAARTAGEFIGLSTVLMAAGTSALVASSVPLPDAAVVPLLVGFHRQLCSGSSVASSLSAAISQQPDDAIGLVLACALGCFGRGDLRLAAEVTRERTRV